MANYVYGTVMVRGKRKNVDEFEKILSANYNYNDMTFSYTPHFFRVFQCIELDKYDSSDTDIIALFNIECAWSVRSCLFKDGYYDDLKDKFLKDFGEFYGTHIQHEANRLNLIIEIFAEEEFSFEEHYIINNNGYMIKNECEEYREYYIGDYDTVNDFNDEYDLNLSESEFEELKDKHGYSYREGGFYDTDFSINNWDNICDVDICTIINKD